MAAMKKVLIIEDDQELCSEVAELLKDAGYETLELCRGEVIMENLKKMEPALILLDVMMPVMDGWEILKRIRDDPALEGVKIVMMTAKRGEKDKMIGLDILKADDYLTKPFRGEELLDKVKGLLPAEG